MTMDERCEALSAQLSAYVDGELGPDEQASLERHLGTCEGCMGRVRSLHRLVDAVAGLPRPSAPEGFLVAVRARIEQGPSWSERLEAAFAMQNLVAVGSLACLALLAFRVSEPVGLAPSSRLRPVAVVATAPSPAPSPALVLALVPTPTPTPTPAPTPVSTPLVVASLPTPAPTVDDRGLRELASQAELFRRDTLGAPAGGRPVDLSALLGAPGAAAYASPGTRTARPIPAATVAAPAPAPVQATEALVRSLFGAQVEVGSPESSAAAEEEESGSQVVLEVLDETKALTALRSCLAGFADYRIERVVFTPAQDTTVSLRHDPADATARLTVLCDALNKLPSVRGSMALTPDETAAGGEPLVRLVVRLVDR